ncbi:MAG: hypothetical protein NOF05_21870 [Candidatus Accumulibacter phosphatis]|nr:hypothetical protein [Candidatus Accumulibacter phosphatis]
MLFSWHRDVIVGDAFLRPKAGFFHINLSDGDGFVRKGRITQWVTWMLIQHWNQPNKLPHLADS